MQNNSGHTLVRLATVLLAVVLFAACGKVKDISVTSCDVKSISPNGLRAVDMVLGVGVNDPAMDFTVSDIEGELRNGESTVATFTGGPVEVHKKSDEIYDLPCAVKMGDNLSLFDMLSIVRTKDFSNMKIDVTAQVRLKNGISKTLKYNDLSVQELMDKADIVSKLK